MFSMPQKQPHFISKQDIILNKPTFQDTAHYYFMKIQSFYLQNIHLQKQIQYISQSISSMENKCKALTEKLNRKSNKQQKIKMIATIDNNSQSSSVQQQQGKKPIEYRKSAKIDIKILLKNQPSSDSNSNNNILNDQQLEKYCFSEKSNNIKSTKKIHRLFNKLKNYYS